MAGSSVRRGSRAPKDSVKVGGDVLRDAAAALDELDRVVGPLEESVRAEVAAMTGVVSDRAFLGSFGELAFRLAAVIESPGTSATARSMCSGQLKDVLLHLHSRVPAELVGDGLDKLRAKREARRKKAAE